MENNSIIDALRQFQTRIQSEHIELIDFDSLLLTLQSAEQQLTSYHQNESDLLLLKDSIAGKIIGMEKAITAVTENKEIFSGTMQLIESLPRLNAEQLLQQYSRTRARFHDAFPTTFEQASNIDKRKLHYEDYK